jgi:hypothetical protein
MSRDLTTEATEALRVAAERLGVDALRLAGFLGGGRLAEILETLSRLGHAGRDRRRIELTEQYVRFLDGEIERQKDRPAAPRRNGA